MHEGHLKLLDTACRWGLFLTELLVLKMLFVSQWAVLPCISLSEGIPCFEMSAINADKPPLSLEEIKSRVKQFEDKGSLIFSRWCRFEISMLVSRRKLDDQDGDSKLRLYVSHAGRIVVVTNQPYFYRKAELFPDSTFVVGFDTAIRLLNVS